MKLDYLCKQMVDDTQTLTVLFKYIQPLVQSKK